MRRLLALIISVFLIGCSTMQLPQHFVYLEVAVPSASPEAVEERLALPSEEVIAHWPEVRTVRSRSALGMLVVEVELKHEVGEEFTDRLIKVVLAAARSSEFQVVAVKTRQTIKAELL
jgi:Cu/Ag efflux pump CusA